MIHFEQNYLLNVEVDKNIGVVISFNTDDTQVVKDFADFVSRNLTSYVMAVLPMWIEWLNTRGVKTTTKFRGSWYSPSYWVFRAAYTLITRQYKTLPLKRYKENYEIYDGLQ